MPQLCTAYVFVEATSSTFRVFQDYEVVSFFNDDLGCYFSLWITTYIPRSSGWRTHQFCADSVESISSSMEAGPGWQSTLYIEFSRKYAASQGRFWLKLEGNQLHTLLGGITGQVLAQTRR